MTMSGLSPPCLKNQPAITSFDSKNPVCSVSSGSAKMYSLNTDSGISKPERFVAESDGPTTSEGFTCAAGAAGRVLRRMAPPGRDVRLMAVVDVASSAIRDVLRLPLEVDKLSIKLVEC